MFNELKSWRKTLRALTHAARTHAALVAQKILPHRRHRRVIRLCGEIQSCIDTAVHAELYCVEGVKSSCNQRIANRMFFQIHISWDWFNNWESSGTGACSSVVAKNSGTEAEPCNGSPNRMLLINIFHETCSTTFEKGGLPQTNRPSGAKHLP